MQISRILHGLSASLEHLLIIASNYLTDSRRILELGAGIHISEDITQEKCINQRMIPTFTSEWGHSMRRISYQDDPTNWQAIQLDIPPDMRLGPDSLDRGLLEDLA
jgi:hypothetical protein